MKSTQNILDVILKKDLSKIIELDGSSPCSLYGDDFPNKEEIKDITDLRLLQLILVRRALVEKSGYLGEQIRDGEYIEGDKGTSSWIIYKLNDSKNRIGVFWSHYDDDSWSVFFSGDNLDVESMFYEN